MIYNNITIGGEIYHHGVKGMKWGVRRYQPYTSGYSAKNKGRYVNTDNKEDSGNVKKKGFSLSDRQKKMIKIGAIAAGTALAAYGAYKVADMASARYIAKKLVDRNVFQNAVRSTTSLTKSSRKLLGTEAVDSNKYKRDLLNRIERDTTASRHYNNNKLRLVPTNPYKDDIRKTTKDIMDGRKRYRRDLASYRQEKLHPSGFNIFDKKPTMNDKNPFDRSGTLFSYRPYKVGEYDKNFNLKKRVKAISKSIK